jgi:hypothetical protein
LYFLAHFLKLYAVRFEQQRFALLSWSAANASPLELKKVPPPGFCPASVIERVQPWLDLDRPEGRQPQWQQY